MVNISNKTMLCSLFMVFLLVIPGVTRAETVRDQYFKAENAYKKMLASPNQRKYRHHWLRVIAEFQKVYDTEPGGSWAAAGLYRTGATYVELYRRSGRQSDRDAGIERLQKVRHEFPRSAYRAKAASYLKEFPAAKSPPKVEKPAKPKPTEAAAQRQFDRAENCQTRLKQNPRRTKHRDVWLTCINAYEDAYQADPEGPLAAASLFKMGSLYQELAEYSKSSSDREAGEVHLRNVINAVFDQSLQPHGQSPVGREKRTANQQSRSDASRGNARCGRSAVIIVLRVRSSLLVQPQLHACGGGYQW